MRKHVVLFVLAALPAGAAENPLTGTWTMETSVAGTSRIQTCNLTQTGAQLAGACVGDDGTTSDFSGKVEGDTVDLVALKAAGLLAGSVKRAKIILAGKIDKAVKVQGVAVTKGAKAAIEAAGGSIAA